MKTVDKKLIYLAAPYSYNPEDPLAKKFFEKFPKIKEYYEKTVVMPQRFKKITLAAAVLSLEKDVIFSPISHAHPMRLAYDLPGKWSFWEKIDKFYIDRCDELWVLMIPGWNRSIGVSSEIKYATEIGLRVKYISWLTIQSKINKHKWG